MRASATTETYQTLDIKPAAPWRVFGIKVESAYRLEVFFMDGSSGWVDLGLWLRSKRIDGSIFEPLRGEDFFRRAEVALGAITWPNGADLPPDVIYDAIRLGGIWQPT